MLPVVLFGLGLLTVAFIANTDDDDQEAGRLVEGEETDDTLSGGGGDDTITGGEGNDLLIGRGGDDRMFGGEDDDIISGDTGDDFIRGGAGDDLLIGGAGEDTLRGDLGDDLIVSADVLDSDALIEAILNGETPDLSLFDFSAEAGEADTVTGGFGDDTIITGSNDEISSGNGADNVTIGDWIVPGEPATFSDYEEDQDSIFFVHRGNAPEITTETDENGTATVFVDGEAALIVPNAGSEFGADDILLERI